MDHPLKDVEDVAAKFNFVSDVILNRYTTKNYQIFFPKPLIVVYIYFQNHIYKNIYFIFWPKQNSLKWILVINKEYFNLIVKQLKYKMISLYDCGKRTCRTKQNKLTFIMSWRLLYVVNNPSFNFFFRLACQDFHRVENSDADTPP